MNLPPVDLASACRAARSRRPPRRRRTTPGTPVLNVIQQARRGDRPVPHRGALLRERARAVDRRRSAPRGPVVTHVSSQARLAWSRCALAAADDGRCRPVGGRSASSRSTIGLSPAGNDADETRAVGVGHGRTGLCSGPRSRTRGWPQGGCTVFTWGGQAERATIRLGYLVDKQPFAYGLRRSARRDWPRTARTQPIISRLGPFRTATRKYRSGRQHLEL